MAFPQKIAALSTAAAGEGLAVLDIERKQSYVLNATSALVFQHCDGQTSPEQLAEILGQKFNLRQAEAEHLTQLALEELETAQLLVPDAVHAATFSRRQALTFATLGLSVALLPAVAKAAGAHCEAMLIPLLECVENNGNGTFTAHFGYLNTGSRVIILPVGPKNMFVGGFEYRGQPIVFEPGEHLSVFRVVFGARDTLKWLLKADGDSRRQVEASATSEGCSTPTPTPTPPPTPTPTPTPPPTPTPTPTPPPTPTPTPTPPPTPTPTPCPPTKRKH